MSPMPRIARAFAIVLLALAALVLTLGVHGYGLLQGAEDREVLPLRVRPDPALAARGRHLAELSCAQCHSPDGSLPLAGGRSNFLHDPGGPDFGTLTAPNLTPASRLAHVTDPALARAIREGIGFDRRPMLVMPSGDFRGLSDRDLSALVSYLRAQPAVADTPVARRISALAYLVLGMQALETSLQRPVTKPVPAVPEAPTPQYGEYLVDFLGCAGCHGQDFRGGRSPLIPRGPDLRPATSGDSPATLALALREGIGTNGRALDPRLMPWTSLRHLTDVEVRAIAQHLRRQTGKARPGS